MRKRLPYVLRASPGRGWGSIPRPGRRAGDARRVRRVCALAMVALATLTSFGSAQTENDVFACAKPGVTFDELKETFASLGWTQTKPDKSDIVRQLIFLGNVDARKPESWSVTAKWAERLSEGVTQRTQAVYALDNSAVVLEIRNDGAVICLFVSDKTLDHAFENKFPQLKLRQFGERQFGWFDQPDLKVSAAFVYQSANELAAYSDGRHSSATIVNKSASGKEDQ